MIDYLRGILVEKLPSRAIIEAGGIGYAVMIPLSTYEALPEKGTEIKILTHLSIREDAHKLYGFFTNGERDLFRQLIEVNMIGPKVGLGILSNITVEKMIDAVASGDASRLKSIPGIGPKTALRLIMELKGKIDDVDVASSEKVQPGASHPVRSAGVREMKKEVYEAMISLGYLDKQVIKVLDRVESTIRPDAPLEDWIKMALQVI